MKKTLLFVLLIFAYACQTYSHSCIDGYSYSEEVGACIDKEYSIHEIEVINEVLMVQSYNSFTVIDIEPKPCEDCYDVIIKRNDEHSEPYVIPYRDGKIDHSHDGVSNFIECVDAGNPVMESYPRQCRDPISGNTFVEEIKYTCSEADKSAELCTADYNPVCGEYVLNTGETHYETFSNGCSACSAMKVVAYTPGACEDKLFVVCEETFTGFDPQKFADENGGICVSSCPTGFDPFVTQIGITQCIPHYGLEEINRWEICERSSDTCRCVKAYETTTPEPIERAEYRCVPDDYADRLIFRGGIDSLDEKGEQSVMIA